MFRSRYSVFLTALLVIAIIAVVVICAVAGIRIYKNHVSDKENKRAIAEFISNTDASNTNTNRDIDHDDEDDPYIIDNIIVSNNVTDENLVANKITDNTNTITTVKPKKVKFYKDFIMIGYIQIPKTGIKLPILTDTSAEALETSVGVLYPTNPELNEPGNVVIIGHNYRNGKFFSDNKKLSVGDKIKITDEQGDTLTYTIYEIFDTTPEDAEYMTRDTGGNIEISLSTCSDDGTKRLIILAKA